MTPHADLVARLRAALAEVATDDAAYRAMRERVIAEQDARAKAMEGR